MMMEEAVNQEDAEKVIEFVRAFLEEGYKDDFVFDPILVELKTDHDGDEYVKVTIVFDGDQNLLDPHRAIQLLDRLWSFVAEIGYPNVPGRAFIEKSEWEELCEDMKNESTALA